jgi:hypothetical protein
MGRPFSFFSPTSPANAGAQIHSERQTLMRLSAEPGAADTRGSIWASAFAGEVGT